MSFDQTSFDQISFDQMFLDQMSFDQVLGYQKRKRLRKEFEIIYLLVNIVLENRNFPPNRFILFLKEEEKGGKSRIWSSMDDLWDNIPFLLQACSYFVHNGTLLQ